VGAHAISPLLDLSPRATFAQVGIVVPDMDEALRERAGNGPWQLWTYDRAMAPGLHCGGEPADYAFRVALDVHDPQIELIQPLDEGSPYASWLAEGNRGLHHLGYLVEDLAAAIAAMEMAGYELLMGGTGHGADGTGGFAYFDTVAQLGYLTEAIERPGRRHEPDAIVP
jgi:methylmalonyl-CoA/ethylmalonyl-CoA epimerase